MTRKEIRLRLFEGLRRAVDAADDPAIVASDDGGSCNLDTPMFAVARCPEAVIEEAAQAAGVLVSHWKHGNHRGWALSARWRGQGNRRTRQMEAVLSALRHDQQLQEIPGFSCWGHYAMD